MLPYSLDSFELVLSPNMIMVDTNVLMAAFTETNDGRHATAHAFVSLLGEVGLALVPIPVLVEAWGMIVGSRKNRTAGLAMLEWASNPLLVKLIPGHHSHTAPVEAIARQYNVDIVDAWILWLISDMHVRCKLNDRVRVATFDTRDFLRCAGRFPLRLYDIDADENLDY